MTYSVYNGFYYHKRNYHLGKKSHRVCTVFRLFSLLKKKKTVKLFYKIKYTTV